MIQKQPKPPSTRRRFANTWGELDYLYNKIRYWLYERKKDPGLALSRSLGQDLA